MKVTTGRIVHYSEVEGDCLAAVVTAVSEGGAVNLAYWGAVGGSRVAQDVSEGFGHNRWHWPEREG